MDDCTREDLMYFMVKKHRLLYCVDYGMFDEGEEHLINLYKFLGLKHRSINLLTSNDNYQMSREIAKLVMIGICDSCVRYFMDN